MLRSLDNPAGVWYQCSQNNLTASIRHRFGESDPLQSGEKVFRRFWRESGANDRNPEPWLLGAGTYPCLWRATAETMPESDSRGLAEDDLDTTASLFRRIRAGDPTAKDHLVQRYLPALRRWARGRLPARARRLLDTDDLVQVTFLRALDQVMEFEPRRTGAFLAYLRRTLTNQIRDEIRKRNRSPVVGVLPEDLRSANPSPLEEAIGKEALETYESALSELTDQQQEAVVLRIELGFNYDEVATAMGSPSANAARMTVSRALVRLAEVMDERKR